MEQILTSVVTEICKYAYIYIYEIGSAKLHESVRIKKKKSNCGKPSSLLNSPLGLWVFLVIYVLLTFYS